jgi:hypothetical protein
LLRGDTAVSTFELRSRSRIQRAVPLAVRETAEQDREPDKTRDDQPVGFANSGGLVFMDESAEEIPTL